ncbi:hypothetical protein U1Q18_021423 [Sarracenia purpurea var. burkii]
MKPLRHCEIGKTKSHVEKGDFGGDEEFRVYDGGGGEKTGVDRDGVKVGFERERRTCQGDAAEENNTI